MSPPQCDPDPHGMTVDSASLLRPSDRQGDADVFNGSAPCCWAGDQPTHMVDVQQLSDVKAKNPDLEIAACCDRHGARIASQCGAYWCFLVVMPCAGLSVLHMASGAIFWISLSVCGVLLIIGVVTCCACCCPVLGAALAPPPPADCVAPLVAREANDSHGTKPVKRVALLYNPNAGKGKARELLRDVVVPNLQAHGVQVDEVPTSHVGHARELGRRTDFSNLDGLVVMGGDGTLHEVVNGLLAREDSESVPPLGLIPLGSGNALAADFRQNQLRRGVEVSVYRELETVTDWALDRVTEGHSCKMDVLAVTAHGQRLASVALVLFGLMAEIDVVAEPLRWMGPGRFDLAAVWAMLKRRPMPPCRIEMRCPNGSWQTLTNVSSDAEDGSPWLGFALDLGQHWSDTIRASPTSQLDDGRAELHVLHAGTSRRTLFKGFNLMSTGAHQAMPRAERLVETHQFTELNITFPSDGFSSSRGLFNVDGEMFHHDGHINVVVLPRRLRIFCDPNEECEAPSTPNVHAAHQPSSRGSATTYKAYPQRWSNMALFMFSCMVNQMVWVTFTPIAGLAGSTYQMSQQFVNMFSMSFMIVYIPTNFLATYFIDRIGCKPSLLLGSFMTTIGAGLRVVAVEYVDNVSWKPVLLLFGQILAAFGQPFITNMPPKIAHVWFPTHQRTVADTFCSLSGPVGAAVGFLLPTAITNGKPDMMNTLLLVEFIITVVPFLMSVIFFRSAPPTPPSASAAFAHGQDSTPDSSPQIGSSPLGPRKGVFGESLEAVRDRNFLALMLAFAAGNGTFNTMATLLEQLVGQFGFSDDDASNLGADVIISGLVGAAICTAILGYTHNFRGTLFVCFLGALVATVCASVVVPMGASRAMTVAGTYLFNGLLGFFMTPVMPIAFETSVELMFPAVGEAVVSGLCMSGGQVIGIIMTVVLQSLCDSGHAEVAWWLLTCGMFLGFVSISFLRKSSVGARRRQAESFGRHQKRERLFSS